MTVCISGETIPGSPLTKPSMLPLPSDWVFICRGYKVNLLKHVVCRLSRSVSPELSHRQFIFALFVSFSDTEVALKVAPTKYLISHSDGEKGCKQDRWHFTCYEMMQLITTLPCVKTHKSIQTGGD
ncbi:hypothetical protein XENOCAPTIV_003521 [Xenoophorus captivus]|uniref:Uncharacterized protein n=2 Tax=Goodeidae TaxID=28758 RepID=A0ABV0S7X8_9TELE